MNDHAKRRQPLPPRDPARSDTEQGLFQKFIVTRTDGSSGPGGKHEHCEYFVLDIDHDQHAMPALEAYARTCAATHPELAVDLQQRYGLPVDATMPPTAEQVLRRRAHAIGIARDIADAFNREHSDWANSGPLFRKLVDELLTESELVRAIAAWHRATERMVDGTPPGHEVESDRSISDRARGLLAQLEALGIRSVLSAHHEEWWRIHGDHERLQREVLQVLHDGLRARQRAAGGLVSQAQSDAAVEALASAEMPHAVPGRARDLAACLENFSRTSRMGGSWTVGMAVDFLQQVANHWNRRPAAGMNLSRERAPAVHARPVLLETTALWAGAQTSQSDGAVHFTREAWEKFVQALGAEPPLEILVSPTDSVRADQVHQRCAERGCQEALTCPAGRCVMFDRQQPCGCREGECESKPDRACRMTREIQEGGHQ